MIIAMLMKKQIDREIIVMNFNCRVVSDMLLETSAMKLRVSATSFQFMHSSAKIVSLI